MTESKVEDLDLSSAVKSLELTASDKPTSLPDIPFLQEQTRAQLARWLIYGLAASLVGISVFIVFRGDPSGNRELITLVWTSQVTLAGSALGFYFGSKGN